ncbi:MAG: delta-aminolevulinic acid dehydratase [Pseudomonadota bacterium]
MRIVGLLYLTFLLGITRAYGDCECLWQGSFADVAKNTDLVVAGKVESVKGNSLDLALQRTLEGETDHPSVRVWLKTDDYCRPEAELFPEGSEWVMALSQIHEEVEGGFNPFTPNVSYGRVGDYYLSSCGGYWLGLNGEWVTGNLVEAPRWARDPEMTPVLLDLLDDYLNGNLSAQALLDASRADPVARDLMLDTKAFLRDSE